MELALSGAEIMERAFSGGGSIQLALLGGVITVGSV